MMKSKLCLGPCNEVKLLSEFSKQAAGTLGRTSRCKKCRALQTTKELAKKITPIDRFLDALARDREKRGVHYSTMKDAFRVLTVVLGYKEPER